MFSFDFIKNFQLYPDSNFSTLYYTRLKLGFNTKHSDKWSFMYCFQYFHPIIKNIEQLIFIWENCNINL
jgi:hypothetical protein